MCIYIYIYIYFFFYLHLYVIAGRQECFCGPHFENQCPRPGLFNLLNKWADKENHWVFMGHTE